MKSVELYEDLVPTSSSPEKNNHDGLNSDIQLHVSSAVTSLAPTVSSDYSRKIRSSYTRLLVFLQHYWVPKGTPNPSTP